MARELRQNAIQYLYLHLFTTMFVAVLITLTQKCHLSGFKHTKSRTLTTAGTDGRRTEQSRLVIKCK